MMAVFPHLSWFYLPRELWKAIRNYNNNSNPVSSIRVSFYRVTQEWETFPEKNFQPQKNSLRFHISFPPLLYLRTDLKPNAKVRVEDLTPKYFPRGPCIERNFLEACFFCCHRHLSQPSYSCCTFSLRQCWHVLYSQSHFQMLILLVSHKKLSHFQRSLIVVVCHSSHSSRRRWKLCTRKRGKHKVE